jgi:hypothetical protein
MQNIISLRLFFYSHKDKIEIMQPNLIRGTFESLLIQLCVAYQLQYKLSNICTHRGVQRVRLDTKMSPINRYFAEVPSLSDPSASHHFRIYDHTRMYLKTVNTLNRHGSEASVEIKRYVSRIETFSVSHNIL